MVSNHLLIWILFLFYFFSFQAGPISFEKYTGAITFPLNVPLFGIPEMNMEQCKLRFYLY